jgi:hypothetical protein
MQRLRALVLVELYIQLRACQTGLIYSLISADTDVIMKLVSMVI